MDLKERLENIQRAADEQNNAIKVKDEKSNNEVTDLLKDITTTDEDDIVEDMTKESITPNYAELHKKDMEAMSDDDFTESRKEAFNSVKDDFKKRADESSVVKSTDDVKKPMSVKEERPMTNAEKFEQKNAIIKKQPKRVIEDNIDDDPNSALIKGMEEIEADSAKKSEVLHMLHRQEMERRASGNAPNAADESDSSGDDISDILGKIEEESARKELDMEEDNEDLTAMLEKLEANKVYATYESPDEYRGPAAYVVDENKDYQDVVENVLDENNIKVVKASTNERNAILQKFSNSGDTVTVPLVNSSIYVTVSGASANEIISMNNITGGSLAETTLKKLSMLNEHIVDSSIGKMRLAQLIKVVSYHDIETLWYALYAATYPENAEISRSCGRCGDDFYIKTNTRDLIINPEDYKDDAKEILNNVSTYNVLLERTVLNKTVRKAVDKGNIIVYIKHPSIEAYVSTSNNITSDTIRNYQSTLIDLSYSIDKLLVRKQGNEYIEIKDPNKIIEIINKVKDTNVLYELLDAIEEVRPNALPSYGYRKTTCPHCGYANNQEAFSIQELLFTSAQQESEMATLRWAAKLQKKRQQEKK